MSLTDKEQDVLRYVSRYQGVCTPQGLENQTGRPWQGIVRTIAALERKGLVHVRRLGKQTSYTITRAGAAAAAASTWTLTGSTRLAQVIAGTCQLSQGAAETLAAQAVEEVEVDFETRTSVAGRPHLNGTTSWRVTLTHHNGSGTPVFRLARLDGAS